MVDFGFPAGQNPGYFRTNYPGLKVKINKNEKIGKDYGKLHKGKMEGKGII